MRRRPALGYLFFIGVAAAITLALALGGREVLLDRAGATEARAWEWGCVVSFAASALSGLGVLMGRKTGAQGVTVALGTMLMRLVALTLLASAAAILLELEPQPFLLAVATSYLALLVIDTLYALEIVGRL